MMVLQQLQARESPEPPELERRGSVFGGRGHSADWASWLWSLPIRISLSVPAAETGLQQEAWCWPRALGQRVSTGSGVRGSPGHRPGLT